MVDTYRAGGSVQVDFFSKPKDKEVHHEDKTRHMRWRIADRGLEVGTLDAAGEFKREGQPRRIRTDESGKVVAIEGWTRLATTQPVTHNLAGPQCTPLAAAPTNGSNIVWPELTEFQSFRNKRATEEDVNAGRAVFVLQGHDGPVGTPIDMELPQYAYHIDQDRGTKTPGILIQAEEMNGQQIAGFFSLSDRSHMAATLGEFQLLGTRRPE
jgi:hypothetical protein